MNVKSERVSDSKNFDSGGRKERGERRDPIPGLTRAQTVVWWLGNSDEAAAEEELSSDITQAWREGKKRGGGCSENQRRHLPFIGVLGLSGEAAIDE
jgi:hypothetical protein